MKYRKQRFLEAQFNFARLGWLLMTVHSSLEKDFLTETISVTTLWFPSDYGEPEVEKKMNIIRTFVEARIFIFRCKFSQ